MWIAKVLVYAHQRRWKDVKLGKVEVPPADEENAGEANDACYTALTLCSEDGCFFSTVEKAKTDVLPDGDAALARANLINRFAQTSTSDVKLWREFTASKLGGQIPDKWLAELEHLQQCLKECPRASTITDYMIISKVLESLAQDLKLIVIIFESQLREGKLTLKILADNLRQKYKNCRSLLQGQEKSGAFASNRYEGICRN